MKPLSLDTNKVIALAPMEDVTDLPFRLTCKRLGADIVYTEFINAIGLTRASEKTLQKIVLSDEERPVGIQIYGADVEPMVQAAKIAEAHRPDLIDINCGCWVKNVALRGAGAGLLRDLPRMEAIAAAVVKAVGVPVTLKTRLGWDAASIRIVEVAQMCKAVGIQAVTIHCRTRDQGHTGSADWSWVSRIKENVEIPVIANGDIDSAESVRSVFKQTGADGVMIGRGAIDNPWIFKQAKEYLQTGELLAPPALEDRIRILLEHLRLSVEFKGERKGVVEFRKHYSGYLRDIPHVARLRSELMGLTEVNSVVDRLQAFLETNHPEVALVSEHVEV